MFRTLRFLSVLFCSVFLMGAAAYADAEFTVTTTPDTTTFSFKIVAAGEFTVDWGDGNVETITKENTASTTYSHTYSMAGVYNIGLSGQATAYTTSNNIAAISFYTNSTNAKKVAGISGSLGAIFGTLSSGTNIQPRFYSTFSDCTNMTGTIPAGLFDGIYGQPVTYMFYRTFYNCSGLTGNVPAGLFSGLEGTPTAYMFYQTFYNCSNLTGHVDGTMFSGIAGTADSAYGGTFSNVSKMDTACPENTYGIEKLDGSWHVAVCLPCPDGTASAQGSTGSDSCVAPSSEPEFTVTTTADTTSFSFKIRAKGTFYVDWGDGSDIETITPSSVYLTTTVAHTYSAAGAYNIGLSGQATAYDNNDLNGGSISFSSNKNVAGISGSLGAIFGTLSSGTYIQPTFYMTFYNCSNLKGSIPEDLFSGIYGAPRNYMFYSTFDECRGLTGDIPEDLFAGIEGAPTTQIFTSTFRYCYGLTGEIPAGLFRGLKGAPTRNMFLYTFRSCRGLTGSIPENLFAGIEGAPAENMFAGVFDGCWGLTGTIPADLFKGISGKPAKGMFNQTFSGCTGLTGSIPKGLFGGIEGAPAESMFYLTFSGDKNLTGGIPAELFRGISGAPAKSMFGSTFSSCSGLTSIPEDLFAGIEGAPAVGMFSGTFSGWTGLTSIPEKLFSGIKGKPASEMFYGTFSGCSALTSIPAKLFAGISGAPAYRMFRNTFSSCSGLTDIPAGLFGGVEGKPASEMFSGTFYRCKGLTGNIPDGLFGTLSGAPATEMFKQTFYDCNYLTGSIPAGLFGDLSGAPASQMFYETFYDCYRLTGNIPAGLFGNLSGKPASEMFKSTFSYCYGLTGNIPDGLFGSLSGAPAASMFEYTFYACSKLTGNIPLGLFGNLSGTAADSMFSNTFSGCGGLTGYVDGRLFTVPGGDVRGAYSGTFGGASSMDTACPDGTYMVDKPNTAWTVAVCLPCPDEYPDSDSEAPSVDMCYVAQSCDGGAYYDNATAQCTTCPAGSYCVGGTKKAYSNGDILGDSPIATLCPGGSTSPAGSADVAACACNAGFAFNSAGNCGALCGSGVTKLQTSSGLSVPLFAAKTTSPSIFVSNRADAMCYADLVTGAASGAINVNYNGAVYHTVQ